MSTPTKVAIYARVSTDQQRQMSGLDVQVTECRKYAAEAGYEVAAIYQDEGISGSHGIGHRAGLDRMLSDAQAGRFQILLVHELDRLSRELFVGLSIVAMVAESGILLFEVSNRTAFTDQGALLGLVKMWGAGEDRKRILQRTKRGHIARAKKGKVSGPAALGYDKDAGGHLVINPEEAALVRRIFHLYVNEGYNLDNLAALLNHEGVKTRRAKANEAGTNNFQGDNRWQRSTVLSVLKNTAYKGVYVYGKTRGRVRDGKEYTGNDKRPLKDPDIMTAIKNRAFLPHEQVEIEVPAIVDADTWERAQAQRAERASRTHLLKGPSKYTYRFKGIVRCHLCGRAMTCKTMPATRKDGSVRKTPYYVCGNREKACPNKRHHRIGPIDHEIVNRLLPYFEKPELIREGLSSELNRKQKQHEELTAHAHELETQIGKVRNKVQRLLDIYLEGRLSSSDYTSKRNSLDAELEKLQPELVAIQKAIKEVDFDEDLKKVDGVIAYFTHLLAQVPEPRMRWLWGIALGAPEDVDVLDEYEQLSEQGDAVSTLVNLAQVLIKRVTLDRDGKIVDYLLKIQILPPTLDGSADEISGRLPDSKCDVMHFRFNV